jgi:SAM-dependent methyltransferase
MRLRYVLRPPQAGDWSPEGDQGLPNREYRSYDDYTSHQRSKLALLDLSSYDVDFTAGLAARLTDTKLAGKSVLCLAARIGSEVRAFHLRGAFAVGIDLEPGARNDCVLPGDFHHLVFPDACVDLVYCNSLDHALHLEKVVSEVRRVLKPGGVFLADIQEGSDAIGEFDDWAATQWRRIEDVTSAITQRGFRVADSRPITTPWSGREVRFVVDSGQL